jgi:hypothetical protein
VLQNRSNRVAKPNLLFVGFDEVPHKSSFRTNRCTNHKQNQPINKVFRPIDQDGGSSDGSRWRIKAKTMATMRRDDTKMDSRRDGTTESGKTESRRWLVGDADDDEQDVEQRWRARITGSEPAVRDIFQAAETSRRNPWPTTRGTRECQLPASKDKMSAGQVEVSMATHRALNQGQPLGLQSWPTTAESRKRMDQPLDGLALGGPIVSKKRIKETSS